MHQEIKIDAILCEIYGHKFIQYCVHFDHITVLLSLVIIIKTSKLKTSVCIHGIHEIHSYRK